MKSSFWHDKWQQREIGFHQAEVNSHLRQFWPRLPIDESATVFVPLCGKTLDMRWLRDRGHQVVGVELSTIAAEEFFTEQRLVPAVTESEGFTAYTADGIQILCGDFFDLTRHHLSGVAAVFDRAALVALPPDLRHPYTIHLEEILPPGCATLLVTFDYRQEEMQGPPFAVDETEIYRLYGESNRIHLLHREDLMAGAEAERWRERGLSRVVENVYLLGTR